MRIFIYTSRYAFFITHCIRLLRTSVTRNLLHILYVGRYAVTPLRILSLTPGLSSPVALFMLSLTGDTGPFYKPLQNDKFHILHCSLTDAMYTAPCTGSAVFLCARPRVHLSSVAYVHDIVFAFHTDYLMYTWNYFFAVFVCVTQRWDLRVMKQQFFYILHVDCARLQVMDGAS